MTKYRQQHDSLLSCTGAFGTQRCRVRCLFPFWCLVFVFCFDSHSCFNKGLLYCRCVCSVHWFMPEDWTPVARKVSFVPHCRSCSLPEAVSIPWEEKWTQPIIPQKERDIHGGRQVEIPPQGRGRSVWWENRLTALCCQPPAFDSRGLDLLGSLAPLLNRVCLLGDWWSVPSSTLLTRAFLLTSVGDSKSCKSKGWTDHIRRCCTASEMISSYLTNLNQMQMNSRGFQSL